jgi:hypothetical protein
MPRPVPRRCHHAGPHRVQVDVAAHFQQVGVAVHQNGLETALEDMAHLAVAAVHALGENAVDVPHQRREIGLPRAQHQVVVIAHQAVGQRAGVEAVEGLGEQVEEESPVVVVQEDRLLPVATGGDVVDGVGKFDAQRAGHGRLESGKTASWKGKV